ncbi:MAG: DNA gyrase subunit A [Bacilli bacterium]
MNDDVIRNDRLADREITKEIEESFLDYSMSVIVARALPDVRDGLKPVHRRIIYAMNQLGIYPSVKYLKSAKIVGEVMGDFHPHGDASIYDTIVRMAQKFTYRYLMVDGHGNFGSIDGDGAAASRYTEARMSKLSMEMVRDINKDTVNFVDNYDGRVKEPEILPSRFPNIIVNGTSGIAVGMATNIPPHNLGEVIDGTVAFIDNPELTNLEMMQYIKGPDFPTGATILGNSSIKRAYETGRGIITIRSKCEIKENKNGKHEIIVSEIPYQVNKSVLIQKIADLVKDKIVDGISDLRDESNKGIIRIVIEVKKEANANVILNNLFKHTQLQASYGINLLALVNGEPKTLSLTEILGHYINHQKEVIIRRTKFDLNKAENRAHILEGLKIALDNIDAVIKLLRASKTDAEAKIGLANNFNLSDIQAEAILEMKLRKLTGLEKEKVEAELRDILIFIDSMKEILASDEKVLEIIKKELLEIKDKYGDERRTEIDMTSIEYIEDESLIPVEDIIVTLTNKGYIKRILIDTYRSQRRGGVGVKGMTTNEEDFAEHLISMRTHDYILFFSNKGKVYRLKGYEIPLFARQSKGLPIINLLPLEKDEAINSVIRVNTELEENKYLVFFTKKGLIKKTELSEFDSIRNGGKIAIKLKDDDELITVKKSDGNHEILIGSSNGRMVRFLEKEARPLSRNASGLKGINVGEGYVVGAEVINEDQQILIVTELGFGKRTNVREYRLTHRGSKGVAALKITEKNGNLVAIKAVEGIEEDLMIITDSGIIIRMPMEQVANIGRNTQGSRLINLKDNQKVATVAKIKKQEEEEIVEDSEEDI